MSFVTIAVVALLIVAAILQIMGRRVLGGWLLVLFPAFACGAALVDLAQGAARIGQAAYHDDQRQLVYIAVLLAVTLLGALRPKWRWLFWIAWLFNALVCGVMVYLAFFWKVFS